MPNQRAEENPRDPFGTFEPQFEQAVTHGVRVEWPKIGTNINHPAGKNDVPRSQCVGQREDLFFNLNVRDEATDQSARSGLWSVASMDE